MQKKKLNSLFIIHTAIAKHETLLWTFSIIALSFASFWRVFGFGLWKDDWSLIWSSLYNTYYYHGYFNHPGTPLEFFFLSRIFETNAFLWQSLGFFLHVVVSICVGIFISQLTASKKVGLLAGLFFSVSYLGLETIYFPSVQVIQFAAIPLLLSLAFFIRSFKDLKKYFPLSLFFLLLSLAIDPPRIAPAMLLLPLLVFLFPQTKSITFLKKIFLFLYPLFLLGLSAVLVIWFIRYSPNTLLGEAIAQGILTPSFFLTKLHVLGHFFATIANIFTGLFYGLGQDEQNTGVYTRIFGYLGLGIFLTSIGIAATWIKTRKRSLGIISIFLFWIFLFYFPNWISEPRAPMAGAHRYVFLSSIGFIGLVAYLLSFIRNRKLFLFLSIVFLGLNIYKANALLLWQYSYRSNSIVTAMWNTINKDVPPHETNDIFMFYGAQPWQGQDIYLSGAAPYALLRKYYTDPTQMPIFTVDTHAIENYLCYPNQRIINLYFVAYKKDKVPLSHIHAWNVLPGGKLVDITKQEQLILKSMAEKNRCMVSM